MVKKIAICLVLSLVALGGQAVAEIGTIDDVPAATLLLPYFEVDLNSTAGITTLFSINNASASAALAHVTVWSDLSVPVLDFDVYLTGYDVQTINMRDILNGILPFTADFDSDPTDSGDPNDGVSNNGANTGTDLGDPLDVSFPGSTGPCVAPNYGPLNASFVNNHLKPALTGGSSSLLQCVGVAYGDNIARGYVTVDVVDECNLDFPSSPGYFGPGGIALNNNVLWGDYFYVEPGDNFAQGETLVHIEACTGDTVVTYDGYVGNGAGYCPFGLGDFTYYSRYVADTGIDQREGLASQFAVRYITGGAFDGGTDYIVWRDSRSNDIVGGACPAEDRFAWYPLNQELVVAFDEEENAEQLCITESDVSPPGDDIDTCFPIEAGRYNVELSAVPGSRTLGPTADNGWMYLDLDLSSGQRSQAWVTAVMSAEGRFSVGFDAIQLNNVSETPFAF